MSRTLILLLGIVVVVFHVGTFRMVLSQEPPKPVFASEFYDEAVRKQVEPLCKQTLDESLSELDRIEHYQTLAGSLAMSSDGLGVILSSRIFRKCVEEIRSLSPEESARLIKSHIDKTLPAYIDKYNQRIQEAFDGETAFAMAKEKAEREGRSFSPGILAIDPDEGKDGQPILYGLRFKLLALLLIAGSCELTDSHAVVNRIAQAAWEQKEVASKLREPRFQKGYVQVLSLWNPVFLSTALYGTHPHKDLPEFSDIGKRFVGRSLVDYTARYTEYDPLPLKEVIPNKDYIKVRYVERATDDDVLLLMGFTDQ